MSVGRYYIYMVKSNHGGRRPGAGRKPIYGEPTERVVVFLPRSTMRQIRRIPGDSDSQKIAKALAGQVKLDAS